MATTWGRCCLVMLWCVVLERTGVRSGLRGDARLTWWTHHRVRATLSLMRLASMEVLGTQLTPNITIQRNRHNIDTLHSAFGTVSILVQRSRSLHKDVMGFDHRFGAGMD